MESIRNILLDACKHGYTDVVQHILKKYVTLENYNEYSEYGYISNNDTRNLLNNIADCIKLAGKYRHKEIIDLLLTIYNVPYHKYESICSCSTGTPCLKGKNCMDPKGLSLLIQLACQSNCIYLIEYACNNGINISDIRTVSYIDNYKSSIYDHAQLCVWLHQRGISYYDDLDEQQTCAVLNYDESIKNKHTKVLRYLRSYKQRRVTDAFIEMKHNGWDYLGLTGMVCDYVAYEQK